MSLLGALQWGIRQSTEVANHMMSAERILEYVQLPSEQGELKRGKNVFYWSGIFVCCYCYCLLKSSYCFRVGNSEPVSFFQKKSHLRNGQKRGALNWIMSIWDILLKTTLSFMTLTLQLNQERRWFFETLYITISFTVFSSCYLSIMYNFGLCWCRSALWDAQVLENLLWLPPCLEWLRWMAMW